MNALTPTPETPHLTPAERVETLVDAITTMQSLTSAAATYADLIGFECGDANPQEIAGLDDMITDQVQAEAAVCAIAKTLMADGLLERCADMLRATADSQT